MLSAAPMSYFFFDTMFAIEPCVLPYQQEALRNSKHRREEHECRTGAHTLHVSRSLIAGESGCAQERSTLAGQVDKV